MTVGCAKAPGALPGFTPELHQLDHAGLREAAQRGELDFVITNPGHYVELEASLGASRILTLPIDQRTSHAQLDYMVETIAYFIQSKVS